MSKIIFNVLNIENKNKILCMNKDPVYSVFRSRCAVPITYSPNLKGMHLSIKLKEYESIFCIKIKNFVNSVSSLKRLISEELGLKLIDTSDNSFDILSSGSITVMPCTVGKYLNIEKTYTNSNNFKLIGETNEGIFLDEHSDNADLYYLKLDNLSSPILNSTLNNSLALIYGNFGDQNIINYEVETTTGKLINKPIKKKYASNKNGDFLFRANPISETKISIENGISKTFNVPKLDQFVDFNTLKSTNLLSYWER